MTDKNETKFDTTKGNDNKSMVRGDLVNHGAAPYLNDPKNKESYYVELKQLNSQNVILWGKGLKDAIADTGKGDYIGLKRGETTPVIVKATVKVDGKDVEKNVDALKQSWEKVKLDKAVDSKDYEAEKLKSSEKTQSSNSQNQNTKSDKKYTHTKREIEEEEGNSPSFERVVPGSAIANRFLVKHGKSSNSYADRRKPDVELVQDKGSNISAKEVTPESIELIVKLAKEKNWNKIEVSGTKDFKRQLWMEATKEGIEVKGYSPSKEEKQAVEKYMKVNKSTVDKENLVKPIVENSVKYAKENIKGQENQDRFTQAVKEKVENVIEKEGIPKVKEPVKEKMKEVER